MGVPHYRSSTETEQSEKVPDDIFGNIAKIEGSLRRGSRTLSSTLTRTVGPPPVTAKLPKLMLKSYNGASWDGVPFGMLTKQQFMIILVLDM